jgi:G3E family GTPase
MAAGQAANSPAAALLPAVVIGGYLGAGKTTLINHLLRERGGRRIAVLVNDFGEIGIDAGLIEGAEGDVLSLAGGCVCCSYGADLVGALRQMLAREPRPDHLLIETSGVGLPAAVARTAALATGLALEGIVVVADALAVRELAQARYVGDTVRQQLQQADLLLLAKPDLAGDAALAALRPWLHGLDVRAPCVPALHGAVAPEVVLGLSAHATQERPPASGRPPRLPAAATRFHSRTLVLQQPADAAALGRLLVAEGALRAKGLVLDESGRWLELQLVGRRVDLRAASTAAVERLGAGTAGRLVTITLSEG